jgi:hypothetical protein
VPKYKQRNTKGRFLVRVAGAVGLRRGEALGFRSRSPCPEVAYGPRLVRALYEADSWLCLRSLSHNSVLH